MAEVIYAQPESVYLVSIYETTDGMPEPVKVQAGSLDEAIEEALDAVALEEEDVCLIDVVEFKTEIHRHRRLF